MLTLYELAAFLTRMLDKIWDDIPEEDREAVRALARAIKLGEVHRFITQPSKRKLEAMIDHSVDLARECSRLGDVICNAMDGGVVGGAEDESDLRVWAEAVAHLDIICR